MSLAEGELSLTGLVSSLIAGAWTICTEITDSVFGSAPASTHRTRQHLHSERRGGVTRDPQITSVREEHEPDEEICDDKPEPQDGGPGRDNSEHDASEGAVVGEERTDSKSADSPSMSKSGDDTRVPQQQNETDAKSHKASAGEDSGARVESMRSEWKDPFLDHFDRAIPEAKLFAASATPGGRRSRAMTLDELLEEIPKS